MPVPYRTLFLLDSAEMSLVEIKRLDRPDEPDRGTLYSWLQFDKAAGTLTKLDFVSMDSQPEAEQREFRQGQLRFDLREATYRPADDTSPRTLLVCPTTELPAALAAAIDRYLLTA
ncbi:hypothetical protein [Hymenobacter persicinus]|uniref:Uncharacterized protein n=1 Tax=Hymenobacter persicinus TaxID=2025506 RepID=A0A4Q5LEK0_9BACT|nr:hypothetical protein [Hymenobacter persicinus]RYU82857.1 hypothetical protein EWM57_03980 [Hymenobacter persicinus]